MCGPIPARGKTNKFGFISNRQNFEFISNETNSGNVNCREAAQTRDLPPNQALIPY